MKISDGGDRARIPATTAVLDALGVDPSALDQLRTPAVLGGGHPVGVLRATGNLRDLLTADRGDRGRR